MSWLSFGFFKPTVKPQLRLDQHFASQLEQMVFCMELNARVYERTACDTSRSEEDRELAMELANDAWNAREELLLAAKRARWKQRHGDSVPFPGDGCNGEVQKTEFVAEEPQPSPQGSKKLKVD
ncbi:hypothetical protein HMN09_01213600 [Mycena chlorophos]|uniref:Uncharacterized protein n=1 Tax=Mycena chlorophos TaxID=658473 RepID=A0A8H6S6N7_MYCCL|nr:hypothetical protein HMN09_01213600 [Mycena chlorophos]